MSQAGRVAKKISPFAGIAAAGVAGGAAGVWVWRRKSPSPTSTPTPNRVTALEKNDGATTPTPTPASSPASSPAPPPGAETTATSTPTPASASASVSAPGAELQRTGPMVAVYLDNDSVEKLHREYPGANPGRLRKVVIEYNPSADQRSLYEGYFGGSATVELTGEASSENRLALMASVSSSGASVEPQSLSCAVDVTPGDVGGGPLGSTVLIEQIKRAGALTEELWKGPLPAISAHDRDFPSEEGSYNKLDEPLTLTGSICRADWVEGKTGLCRTTTKGGGKREDGWTPQGCSICNTLEASPCRDIYKIFDSMSRRIQELQPPSETQSQSPSAKDDERGASKADSRSETNDGAQKTNPGGEKTTSSGQGGGSVGGKDGQGKAPQESGEDPSKEPETEEERLRREEVKMLEDKRSAVMVEMFTCSQFHHVFEDSNADDGFVPDMTDEEAESGGDSTSGNGGGAGEDDSSDIGAEGEKLE